MGALGEYVDRVRFSFPEGSRIQLEFMFDEIRPLPAGSRGYVDYVDANGIVHCEFDCGRNIGLIPGTDIFHRVEMR